jgi:hypothetical protein
MATLVQAQEVVTSVNAVGYVKKDLPKGSASLLRQDFLTMEDDPTPANIFGDTLPVQSKVYVWNGTAYQISTYSTSLVPDPQGGLMTVTNWNADFNLDPGIGFWVTIPDTAPEDTYSVTLLGEVPNTDSSTNPVSGVALLGFPYPVETQFTATDLAQKANVNDKAYFWNGSSYQILTYSTSLVPDPQGGLMTVTNWNGDVTISLGEGFWYQNTSVDDIDWIEVKPYEI